MDAPDLTVLTIRDVDVAVLYNHTKCFAKFPIRAGDGGGELRCAINIRGARASEVEYRGGYDDEDKGQAGQHRALNNIEPHAPKSDVKQSAATVRT